MPLEDLGGWDPDASLRLSSLSVQAIARSSLQILFTRTINYSTDDICFCTVNGQQHRQIYLLWEREIGWDR